jgi:hypothetical protein
MLTEFFMGGLFGRSNVERITLRLILGMFLYDLVQWYSTFFVRVLPDFLFNFVPPKLLVYNSSYT